MNTQQLNPVIAALFRAAILAFAIACQISSARAVTYKATLLHPDAFHTSGGVGGSNAMQVGGVSIDPESFAHAALWSGTANSFVDLNGSFTSTYAFAATDTQQFGGGVGPSTGYNSHALLWTGTAGSVVDLHPAGYDWSEGFGIDGTHQVGFAQTSEETCAILWNSSASDFVNLNPAGYYTVANGVSGDKQVGYGSNGFDGNHALLWSGTAASMVDLHPSGFDETYAYGVYTNGAASKQVGYGYGSATGAHALLWSGTAASKVDLHPNGFSSSVAYGISAAGQVGEGFSDSASDNHALFWDGTAASVIDLHSTLLADTGHNFSSSNARAIAPNGNIIGNAYDGTSGYAVLWTPVPDVPPESGVAGDYNNDGKVDAADYVTWRKGNTPLHNEVTTIGSNTSEDYSEWRIRFGNPAGSGASLYQIAVPEPTAVLLIILAMVGTLAPIKIPVTHQRVRLVNKPPS